MCRMNALGVAGIEIGQRSSTMFQPAAEMGRSSHMPLDRLCAITSLRQRGDEVVKKRICRRGPDQ
jgi:hypothetical protein